MRITCELLFMGLTVVFYIFVSLKNRFSIAFIFVLSNINY